MTIHYSENNNRLVKCGHSGMRTESTNVKADVTCKRCLRSLTVSPEWDNARMSIENCKIIEGW